LADVSPSNAVEILAAARYILRPPLSISLIIFIMCFSSGFFGRAATLLTVCTFYSVCAAQGISTQEHLRRAGQYLQAKQPEKAIPELQAVVAAEPNNIDAQANLGVLLYFQNQPAAAEPHLRAAITAQPELSKIRGLLGLAERSQGKLDVAREELSRALPDLQDAAFRKQVGLTLVEIDTQQQRLADAVPVLQILRKNAPDDGEILYASYRVYTDLSGDALLSLSLAAPNSGQMQQAIAHELLRVRDIPGAIASFRRAIVIDPNLPGIHTELAETLHASPDEADRSAAEAEYKLGLQKNPHDALAASHLANLYADAGDRTAASALYEQALATQPGNADALLGLAKIDSDEGRDDDALQKLQSVIEADPSNILAHFRLSALYRKLHRPEDAKRELGEYQKLKQLKEDLSKVYSTMKLRAPGSDAAAEEKK
jgi:tetratricopeptide (TPR) repeat protein